MIDIQTKTCQWQEVFWYSGKKTSYPEGKGSLIPELPPDGKIKDIGLWTLIYGVL